MIREREEMERQAKEEAELRAKELALAMEKKKKEEEARIAREQAERIAAAERKAKEEAERQTQLLLQSMPTTPRKSSTSAMLCKRCGKDVKVSDPICYVQHPGKYVKASGWFSSNTLQWECCNDQNRNAPGCKKYPHAWT